MNGVATFLTLMTLEFVDAHACPTTFYTLITATFVFTGACSSTFYTHITATLVLTLVVLSVLLALHTGLAADTFDDFKLAFCPPVVLWSYGQCKGHAPLHVKSFS